MSFRITLALICGSPLIPSLCYPTWRMDGEIEQTNASRPSTLPVALHTMKRIDLFWQDKTSNEQEDDVAPLLLVEKWDNVARLLESLSQCLMDHNRVLLTLDSTPSVVEQSI
ncbi:hypothetical protein EDD85DRAFT_865063 [Armillaria nabsnona]|nr:hypothetical protein EDD85DRAFT_865063 [Armillaria nabsnona]